MKRTRARLVALSPASGTRTQDCFHALGKRHKIIDLQNHVLAGLSKETGQRLARTLRPVELTNDLVIYEPDDRVDTVYFPGSGVVSIIQVMHDGTAAEIGLVGREGICGLDAMLRNGIAAGRHLCQVPGTAWALPAAFFQEELKGREDLLRASLAYVGAYSAMLAQLIACNRLHRVEQRAARWLLMTIDRISALEFPMTQERLSMMLGAQRPTVTAVLAALRDAGCLQNSRGRVRVTDRRCLESFACECYAICAAYFDL